MGFDIGKITANLAQQTPYDAFKSQNDANEDFGQFGISVKQYFDTFAAQGVPFTGAATGATGRIYYSGTGVKLSVILHEVLHATNKGAGERTLYDPSDPRRDPNTDVVSFGPNSALILDSELQTKLGINVQPDSTNITKELERNGCN